MTCSFCGHPPHGDTCPRDIQTAGGKKPTYIPCPCARPRFVTHLITCTTGCDDGELCGGCQCHQGDDQ